MQDIYLFRGKRVDDGEWVEGSLIINTAVQTTPFIVDSCFGKKGKINKDGYEEFDWLSAYEVDPNTVGRCSGRKDKNGKLIFEGDILSGGDAYHKLYGDPEVYYGCYDNSDIVSVQYNSDPDVNEDHDAITDLSASGCGWYLILEDLSEVGLDPDYIDHFEVIGNIHDK